MAETSAFWNSTVTGDASIAPYSHLEFTRIYSKLLGSDGSGFVMPGYANNLNVQASSPAAATVDIATGAALVKGFIYENDSLLTLAIAANASGSPRIDRVVLRVDFAAQTIRGAVIQGTPAANPSPPTPTTVYGTTWEVTLAYVWVASGFATIGNAEIHDERLFAHTFQGALDSDLTGHNLVFNSEFMAYSNLQAAPPTLAPEGWDIFGTIPTIVSATKPTQQPRGRALQMTAGGGNRGLEQTFNVPASKMVAIKLPANVTAGDVGEIVVTTNSASPGTITRTLRRTGVFIEETIYYLTESDATTMTIREYCVNNTDVVTIGQTLAVVGYWPGRFREIHESINFIQVLQDASWLITAKSDGTTTITLSASFGGFVLPGTKAVRLRLIGYDSASAANDLYMFAYPTGSVAGPPIAAVVALQIGGIGNSRPHSAHGIVRLNSSLQFTVEVNASGVGTFTATIYILGIET